MTAEKLPHELEQELSVGMEQVLEPEVSRVRPPFPESVLLAKNQAFDRANRLCEVGKEGCLVHAPIAHQIESRYGWDDYRIPSTVQTADNYVVCCMICHKWIHQNEEQAVAEGYLHQSWLHGVNDLLD